MDFALSTVHLELDVEIKSSSPLSVRLRDDSVVTASSIKELSKKLTEALHPAKMIYVGTLKQFREDALKMTDGIYLMQLSSSEMDADAGHEVVLRVEGKTLKFFDPNQGTGLSVDFLLKPWKDEGLVSVSAHDITTRAQTLRIRSPVNPLILGVAIEFVDIPAVKALITEETVNSIIARNEAYYLTPLCKAVLNDNYDMAAILLEAKANPNLSLIKDPSTIFFNKLEIKAEMTPFIIAIVRGNEDMIRLLLKYGANPSTLYCQIFLGIPAYEASARVIAEYQKGKAEVAVDATAEIKPTF